jgi:hypothetical protein
MLGMRLVSWMELQLIQWWSSADWFRGWLEYRLIQRLVQMKVPLLLEKLSDWSTELLVMLLGHPSVVLLMGLLLVLWYDQPVKAH